MRQVERFVDSLERPGVSDERRQFKLAIHRILDHLRQLGATLNAFGFIDPKIELDGPRLGPDASR
jgi:hypothetical protein